MRFLATAGRGLAVVLAIGIAASASADEIDLESGPTLLQQRAAIEREIAAGDTYVEITRDQLTRVRALLDRMEGLLESRTPGQLTPTQQAELFNMQEEVNQVLLAAEDDSREVCKRERPTGSRLAVTTCLTVAERRRQREMAREDIRAHVTGAKLPNSE